jgi:hypothetical protein
MLFADLGRLSLATDSETLSRRRGGVPWEMDAECMDGSEVGHARVGAEDARGDIDGEEVGCQAKGRADGFGAGPGRLKIRCSGFTVDSSRGAGVVLITVG